MAFTCSDTFLTSWTRLLLLLWMLRTEISKYGIAAPESHHERYSHFCFFFEIWANAIIGERFWLVLLLSWFLHHVAIFIYTGRHTYTNIHIYIHIYPIRSSCAGQRIEWHEPINEPQSIFRIKCLYFDFKRSKGYFSCRLAARQSMRQW